MLHKKISWIQAWHHEQRKEKQNGGVFLETTDSLMWKVKIIIENTEVENKPLNSIKLDRNKNNWIQCSVGYDEEVNSLCFFGVDGPENLEEIIDIFISWVDRNKMFS
ncbi:hypothetical protein BKP35_16165 [Anaerobacillus arseniciselenatis]|uniref:Rhodanese-related sulfurtransferase n=1 Tax=Anaerobacillus arseniciselenatis TaxID=85682 RepID=A0A1S2LBR3_9BACI|nr:Imm53 family immunity protein [Anaerobacillus arseniciselenatis]OIJ09690.1 hypothetical protein BKP35_16165 [Anaerobacillus arseniciselenatis]